MQYFLACGGMFLLLASVFLILYLIDVVYGREYKKTIERCTYHVIGKISENNYDIEESKGYRHTSYHIVPEYIFTINGIKYEKASTWKMRDGKFAVESKLGK